ncbi:MAG: hypothetical protein GX096_07270 [Clostridiales bacterium]|nr:hypothetical protein [Clostridiales bacterium]
MQPNHYFAGANTAQGFFTCFEDIVPRTQRKRMYYIKGGPGVGKSTMMHRVAKSAEEKGIRVEYFHCSSDPDSLDGIALPEIGAGMMDGTAPHVYDPSVPGARDTLLSLGDFLDEGALRPHAKEIERVQSDISRRFGRCYQYLAAARSVYQASRKGVENPQKAFALADEWADQMPLRGGKGSVRRLFAAAYTPKGWVDFLPTVVGERCITVDCPFGEHVTQLMQAVSQRAVMRGLHVVELLDPVSPNEIAHVVIPAHGIAFCSGVKGEAAQGTWVEADRAFDLADGSEKERGFDLNAYELLVQRGVEQLTAAKQLHDELEAFYVGNMDFLKWQSVFSKVESELFPE